MGRRRGLPAGWGVGALRMTVVALLICVGMCMYAGALLPEEGASLR